MNKIRELFYIFVPDLVSLTKADEKYFHDSGTIMLLKIIPTE